MGETWLLTVYDVSIENKKRYPMTNYLRQI